MSTMGVLGFEPGLLQAQKLSELLLQLQHYFFILFNISAVLGIESRVS